MPSTLDIQRALLARGFDPGPLDGVMGRRTLAAIRAFQLSRTLQPDGVVGPLTAAELFNDRQVTKIPAIEPPWLAEARRHLGLKEVAGRAHNQTIVAWLQKLGAGWRDDETPWCGTYVGHCLAATMPREPLPQNPFGARNWLSFGVPLAEPAEGAILVFWRGSAKGWAGHVGFCAGESDAAFRVLGGNQANSVSIASIAKSRLLGIRWPRTAPLPTGGLVYEAAAAPLSVDEA